MKLTTLLTVATATFTMAAPTPAVPETDAAKRDYSDYGTYTPPPGGYGKYGDYGSYPTPAGGYGKYGTYGSYPPPGSYATYGTYARALDWIKSLF